MGPLSAATSRCSVVTCDHPTSRTLRRHSEREVAFDRFELGKGIVRKTGESSYKYELA